MEIAAVRKLPVGIQSFEKLREEGYIYVDKTEYIWNLIQNGSVYFLSRPRRFGKSLLISTLEAYFQGKKELFEGLAIKEKEDARGQDAWQAYPVIRFSLSGGDYHAENGLSDILNGVIEECVKRYDFTEGYSIYGDTLPLRFKTLIEQLYAKTGRQVVVLVDEYDKPLLETMIVNEEQEERNRRLYKGFFSVLKDEDQYLKFVFFTGVTKFSKVSVFSDLNQLDDISLSEEYAGICGITGEELRENFQPEIGSVAGRNRLSEEECLKKLAQMYDGYHFSAYAEGVYNPFSLLKAFRQKSFGRYWFETGTPTFVVNKLEQSEITAEQLTTGIEADESSLTDYRADNSDPLPLLYQAGYLTIRDYDEEFRLYTLGFPNDEVQYGFLHSLAPATLGSKGAESPYSMKNMVLDLRGGHIDSFMERLVSAFARIPYPEGTMARSYEWEWRNEVFLIFMLMGENAHCEVHSAAGRADCIVETAQYVYIFEFKVDRSAEEALEQIDEKGYAEPYRADPRTLMKIGVSFSTQKRNVEEWKTVLPEKRSD